MSALNMQWATVGTHVFSVGMIAARFLPVSFLCPLFGGQLAPTTVRLGIVLSLALFVHVGCSVTVELPATSTQLLGLTVREFVLGTTMGLVASLPFDAARMSGRFVDLFRGSSAEGALPMAGTREAAAGEGLFNLLLAMAASGPVMPLFLASLFRSYRLAPVGSFVHNESVVLEALSQVGTAVGTGLAVGAPIAGVALMTDAFMGLVSRAAQGVNLPDAAAPLKVLGGAAVLCLSLGLVAERLLALAAGAPASLESLLELGQ